MTDNEPLNAELAKQIHALTAVPMNFANAIAGYQAPTAEAVPLAVAVTLELQLAWPPLKNSLTTQ